MQCNICIIFLRCILYVSKCVNVFNDYNDDIDLIGITFLYYQTSSVWLISNSRYLKAAALMTFSSFIHFITYYMMIFLLKHIRIQFLQSSLIFAMRRDSFIFPVSLFAFSLSSSSSRVQLNLSLPDY